MQSLYEVAAPAKLNLFLHVTGRRADGYHLLQSVFMLIDWADTLHFERRQDGQVSREDLADPLPPDDLTVRAARALQAATGCGHGVHIAVHKRIPTQAGLGGGSSDAASCLLALNRLWGLNLSRPDLERIALTLGADVPFFVRGCNAWVEGIGEQLQPLELPAARFVVVKPAAGLETARIFSSPHLNRSTKPATMRDFAAAPYDFGRNDLQPVAENLCHDIRLAIRWLESTGNRGRMTGSGSAVFAPVRQDVEPDLIPSGWVVRTCSNMVVHPLRGWASSDD